MMIAISRIWLNIFGKRRPIFDKKIGLEMCASFLSLVGAAHEAAASFRSFYDTQTRRLTGVSGDGGC